MTLTDQNERALWLEWARHHFQRMDARRAIELRLFIGLAALDLLLAKGAADYVARVEHTSLVKALLCVVLAGVPILYTGMILQIELVNKRDRERYHYYEDLMFDDTTSRERATQALEEGLWRSVRSAWAATWTGVALLALSVLCFVFVLTLSVPSSSQAISTGSPITSGQQTVP